MDFLADESCSGPVIHALRSAGHHVVSIAEAAKATLDESVVERACSEKRVPITEDRDFGELVYARGFRSAGVLFLRFPNRVRRAKPQAAIDAMEKFGDRLIGGFAVVKHCKRAWPGGHLASPDSVGIL